MKAVCFNDFGLPSVLYIGDVDTPRPKEKEILIRVHATALNRADTLQRMGHYPPPKGDSEILGLEIAGEVVEIGNKAGKWKIGDRIFGLVGGGGYAEYAVIHEDHAMAIPDKMSMTDAAGIAEVFLTAHQSLNWLAKLTKTESILIHAGASGVGTAAIQIAKQIGATIFVTASKKKHHICKSLGASEMIDYQSENFEEIIKTFTNQIGVDVILDFLAAAYFQQNINVLKLDGRMVMLAALGGMKVSELQMGSIIWKRLHIMGSTLRARSIDYKTALIKDFSNSYLPAFDRGDMKPIIDSVYEWTAVVEAHERMEANLNAGKIVLQVIT